MGRRRRQRPPLERKYGFFRCNECDVQWTSAHVYCVKGTYKVYYKQECKDCRIAYNPYRVEDLLCPNCGRPAKKCRGMCDDDYSENNDDYDNDDDYYDEDEDDDENTHKPHRADLCHKCRSGWKCV